MISHASSVSAATATLRRAVAWSRAHDRPALPLGKCDEHRRAVHDDAERAQPQDLGVVLAGAGGIEVDHQALVDQLLDGLVAANLTRRPASIAACVQATGVTSQSGLY